MTKTRLDLALVERGLVDSRSLAQRLVMAGQVRVDGQVVIKPATKIGPGAQLVIDKGPRFVSRGGNKLAAAVEAFHIPIEGVVCADVGSSTGGFTDCLLQNGASRVYAIDVGHGILDWKLRNDPRVVVMEKTNARYVKQLPETVAIVTIDVSFISIKKLLPVIKNWFQPPGKEPEGGGVEGSRGTVIALIKPQFEAGRSQVKRGKGVIKDPTIHRLVLEDILSFSINEAYALKGLIRSPLSGPKGNIEFLAHLEYPHVDSKPVDPLIAEVMGEIIS